MGLHSLDNIDKLVMVAYSQDEVSNLSSQVQPTQKPIKRISSSILEKKKKISRRSKQRCAAGGVANFRSS